MKKLVEDIEITDDFETLRKQIMEIMEEAERKAFLEGYKYAITVLEDGFRKKEKAD